MDLVEVQMQTTGQQGDDGVVLKIKYAACFFDLPLPVSINNLLLYAPDIGWYASLVNLSAGHPSYDIPARDGPGPHGP